MNRYGEDFKINQDFMDVIASYMNADIREKVHFELAPCNNEEFLKRYLELDPDFGKVLESEFSINIDDLVV